MVSSQDNRTILVADTEGSDQGALVVVTSPEDESLQSTSRKRKVLPSIAEVSSDEDESSVVTTDDHSTTTDISDNDDGEITEQYDLLLEVSAANNEAIASLQGRAYDRAATQLLGALGRLRSYLRHTQGPQAYFNYAEALEMVTNRVAIVKNNKAPPPVSITGTSAAAPATGAAASFETMDPLIYTRAFCFVPPPLPPDTRRWWRTCVDTTKAVVPPSRPPAKKRRRDSLPANPYRMPSSSIVTITPFPIVQRKQGTPAVALHRRRSAPSSAELAQMLLQVQREQTACTQQQRAAVATQLVRAEAVLVFNTALALHFGALQSTTTPSHFFRYAAILYARAGQLFNQDEKATTRSRQQERSHFMSQPTAHDNTADDASHNPLAVVMLATTMNLVHMYRCQQLLSSMHRMQHRYRTLFQRHTRLLRTLDPAQRVLFVQAATFYQVQQLVAASAA